MCMYDVFNFCTRVLKYRALSNECMLIKGNHVRQDSMEPLEGYHGLSCDCDVMDKELLKPLEKRKQRHQRCLAHSLVGTPNYIAPEVLRRSGKAIFAFIPLHSTPSLSQT